MPTPSAATYEEPYEELCEATQSSMDANSALFNLEEGLELAGACTNGRCTSAASELVETARSAADEARAKFGAALGDLPDDDLALLEERATSLARAYLARREAAGERVPSRSTAMAAFRLIATGRLCASLAEGITPEAALAGDTAAISPSGGFKAVSGVSRSGGCAIRDDDTLTCWHYEFGDDVTYDYDDLGLRAAPEGRFRAISGQCAIRQDDTLTCWRYSYDDVTYTYDYLTLNAVPEGRFKAISGLRGVAGCAIREDNNLTCWSYPLDDSDTYDYDDLTLNAVPEGRFKALSSGYSSGCAIRDDNTLICWRYGGESFFPDYDDLSLRAVPEGRFNSLSADGVRGGCAIRDDDTLTCWHYDIFDDAMALSAVPEGRFKALSAYGVRGGCAIRDDDTLACWHYDIFGDDTMALSAVPEGRFKALSGDYGSGLCAIRDDNSLTCWSYVRDDDTLTLDFDDLTLRAVPAG